MERDKLLADIHRYGVRTRIVYQMLLTGMLVALLMVGIYLLRFIAYPDIEFLLYAALAAAGFSWFQGYGDKYRRRLSMFTCASEASRIRLQIAPRAAGESFFKIPRRFIHYADAPAPAGVCWELDRHAERYAEIRVYRDACKQAHHYLSNHDAANLLLMALGLEAYEERFANQSQRVSLT